MYECHETQELVESGMHSEDGNEIHLSFNYSNHSQVTECNPLEHDPLVWVHHWGKEALEYGFDTIMLQYSFPASGAYVLL